MTPFVLDADLLAYEPNVFVELPFAAQRLLRVTDAALSGATLTSATGGFAALAPGGVVVLSTSAGDAVTGAIASVTDDNTVVLTRAPVGFEAGAAVVVEARTLGPQVALVHAEVMRSIGLDGDDAAVTLDESAVVSVGLMRKIEALGALSRAYAGAVAIVGDQALIEAKAERYRRMFGAALSEAQVLIDTDGDGEADACRLPGVGRMVRA